MLEIRPELQRAYDSLCYQGEQFPEHHELIQLAGPTFIDPEKGEVPIEIDKDTLASQGALYVGDSLLRQALEDHDIHAEHWDVAADLLGYYLEPSVEELVWGFSGYATGGFDPETGKPYGYAEEAECLLALYEYLEEIDQLPNAAIDGGVSEGFLALNSVIATCKDIPTIGFIPREGLGSVGIRNDLIIAGETYPDREALVATADVLAFAGGAAATIRECKKSLENGAAGLVFWHEKYSPTSLPNIIHQDEDLHKASVAGQLVICRSIAEIPKMVDRVLQNDVRASRPQRSRAIAEFLR